MQVCDSKALAKGKSDHYFIIGVSEQEFNARAILVKGSRYPATLPKPVISVLPLKIPLCGVENTANEKSSNEHALWQSRLILRAMDNMSDLDLMPMTDKSTVEATESAALLKLFALACQSDQDSRYAKL